MIRAALVNLWLGITLASLLLAQKGMPAHFSAEIGGWLLAHVNVLLVGWMVQLSMGVAYWIAPRLPNTLTERGRYPFALSAALLINIGVWVYSAGVIFQAGSLQVIGLTCEMISIFAFAIHLVPRIRPAR